MVNMLSLKLNNHPLLCGGGGGGDGEVDSKSFVAPYSDISLHGDSGRAVPTCRFLLGAFSPYLSSMLNDIPVFPLPEIVIPDASETSIRHLLDFLKTGSLTLDRVEYSNVLRLMHMLEIDCMVLEKNSRDPVYCSPRNSLKRLKRLSQKQHTDDEEESNDFVAADPLHYREGNTSTHTGEKPLESLHRAHKRPSDNDVTTDDTNCFPAPRNYLSSDVGVEKTHTGEKPNENNNGECSSSKTLNSSARQSPSDKSDSVYHSGSDIELSSPREGDTINIVHQYSVLNGDYSERRPGKVGRPPRSQPSAIRALAGIKFGGPRRSKFKTNAPRQYLGKRSVTPGTRSPVVGPSSPAVSGVKTEPGEQLRKHNELSLVGSHDGLEFSPQSLGGGAVLGGGGAVLSGDGAILGSAGFDGSLPPSPALADPSAAGAAAGSEEGFNPCQFCEKCFSTPDLLDNHVKHCHSSGRYPCRLCDYSTNCKPNLTRHVNSVHARIKEFQCDICQKMFSQAGSLKLHRESIHMGLKRFACESCSYACATKADLVKHVRRHTGERPYCCGVCGESFQRQQTLKIHELTYHFTGALPMPQQ